MKVLHISAECYPAAKAGGLGDVVGALPKYLNQKEVETAVVIPKYHNKWIMTHQWTEVFRGTIRMHNYHIPFAIEKCQSSDELGFPLYVAHIPGKYDRPGVYIDPYSSYGYQDETERSLCFQQAVLHWLVSMEQKPETLHCHDHHTGLIPFMVKHALDFQSLKNIPTVFTIHNGEYHGAFYWSKLHLLPFFDGNARGLLDWNNTINPLACGIKCCWKLTTVSPGYMDELCQSSNGLEHLIRAERSKAVGILNGIDTQVWNPSTDKFLNTNLNNDITAYKAANKMALLNHFNFDPNLPLITFIGRLVSEKGAHLLPDMISRFLHSGQQANFVVLGTGDPQLHNTFKRMKHHFHGRFDVALEYNEGLAHQLYAGSDFIMMPSKVEPCGLNQLYALRYGTVPIVRSVGGLKDTIKDVGEQAGTGIRFNNYDSYDGFMALIRAKHIFNEKTYFQDLRKRIMAQDFSWERSALSYAYIYNELIASSPKKVNTTSDGKMIQEALVMA